MVFYVISLAQGLLLKQKNIFLVDSETLNPQKYIRLVPRPYFVPVPSGFAVKSLGWGVREQKIQSLGFGVRELKKL